MKDLSRDLSRIAKKTSSTNPWKWEDEDTQSIRRIKAKVKNLPQLALPSDKDELVLEVDASEEHWGAVLKIKGRKPEPVCKYWSGSFKGCELRYPIHEKEVLALKYGIKAFFIFLAPKEFLVRSDSTYVKRFMSLNLKEARQTRLLRLQEWLSYYKYEVEYIRSDHNIIADSLSRELANTFLSKNSADGSCCKEKDMLGMQEGGTFPKGMS